MSLNGMHTALDMVASLQPCELRQRSCTALKEAYDLSWVTCLALDSSGRHLNVDGAADASFACDDFRHPYAHAIRRGKALRLGLGDARSRLDHAGFQAQVSTLAARLEFEVRPLRAPDGDREWLGVLAFAAEKSRLDALQADPGFASFEALLCHLWAGHVRALGERHRRAQLRDSLDKLNEDARRKALSQRLANEILGNSAALVLLREQVVRAAETSLAVLVQGETGSGKDLVAQALHRFSARANGPFIAVNCAAIPEALLESELFGHARGAFSGADQSRVGLLGEADGGTLFLDEIGDMPLALQAKLLRVLESGRYRSLGESEERRADLRLIAATHQPLREHIRDGRFRADLYYRLGQFPLSLPPLRERREDIATLAEAFIAGYCRRENRKELGIAPATLRLLTERDYPGNVRELKNLLDYACVMTPAGRDIEPEVLPPNVPPDTAAYGEVTTTSAVTANAHDTAISDLRQALRDYESELIRDRLQRFAGNRSLAAQSLGLPKRTLAHKCQQLELNAK